MTDLSLYTSEYVTETDDQYIIPINIESYDAGIDFLLVYVNHELMTDEYYSLSADKTSVVFTNPLAKGDVVNMLVFKTSGVDIDVSEFGLPESRNEAILQNILGGTNTLVYPESRIELLLMALLKNINVDASGNENVMAALDSVKANWKSYSTGFTNVANVPAAGPVAGVIVFKFSDDYGAVLILSYHPMFPHPAYCRMFAGEWTTPYWL